MTCTICGKSFTSVVRGNQVFTHTKCAPYRTQCEMLFLTGQERV